MAKQQAKQSNRVGKEQGTKAQDEPQSGTSAGQPQSRRSSAQPEGEDDPAEDHVFGLTSILYHALQGATAARKYKEDAQRAGMDELVEFFEECRSEDTARAKQAQTLLLTFSESEDDEESEDDDDET
jgi:hypothetical protein